MASAEMLIKNDVYVQNRTWDRPRGKSQRIVWNNFPVPELTERQREQIIEAGQDILTARGLHPDRSLAEHYNPLAMDPALLKAHDKLDRAVDKAFGATKKLSTEEQRLEILFRNYRELTAEQ
ncbi:type IIL restriction-modification enzyme MmeI [Rothia koreensis]|uniref:type IIL restriction-modification enzyme MmeI n=1 Tax=Rothia koreensis TaxID=592378 RepID=UPI0037C9D880